MKRLVIVLALMLLLSTTAGCAPQSSGSGEGDGLHSIVPSVIGLDETAARDALDEAGYVVGEVSVDLTSDAEPGTVIEQDPIASTSLPREAEVDIVVAGP
ncbi:MAG: PASTA domain-containing protein [Anaerosomatales bacterium]|nr:PASTA domain-containing protein [Coriobacteriia bacterium]